MKEEIVLFTNPSSSRGRAVRWMLEEVQQPYRAELLDYDSTMKAAAYLAINPMGKVPAIRHRNLVVTGRLLLSEKCLEFLWAQGIHRHCPLVPADLVGRRA